MKLHAERSKTKRERLYFAVETLHRSKMQRLFYGIVSFAAHSAIQRAQFSRAQEWRTHVVQRIAFQSLKIYQQSAQYMRHIH